MMRRLCMSQEIRSSIGQVPPELEGLQDFFANAFEHDARGTLQSETGSFFDNRLSFSNWTKVTKIPSDLYFLLYDRDPTRVPSSTALLQTSVTFGRATYSTASSSEGNSYIIYGEYPNGVWYAGQISDIIVQPHENSDAYEVHLAVRQFDRLSEKDVAMDYYLAQRRSGSLGDIGCLFYKKKGANKTLMDIKDIVCHFMWNPVPVPEVSRQCIHVRPLFRVSQNTIIPNKNN